MAMAGDRPRIIEYVDGRHRRKTQRGEVEGRRAKPHDDDAAVAVVAAVAVAAVLRPRTGRVPTGAVTVGSVGFGGAGVVSRENGTDATTDATTVTTRAAQDTCTTNDHAAAFLTGIARARGTIFGGGGGGGVMDSSTAAAANTNTGRPSTTMRTRRDFELSSAASAGVSNGGGVSNN
eukprot:CAMPEP_0113585600 /NCGR_PEP_ID=MMETSP0015_2-20120614/33793_1 /TAXON_ID=2838 /ORGANISM="Odontella" /LENGTH=176 /DNA_ID=CAMNT_0000490867 /DNA_START=194 /DNA_END=721 /DNA_ORIENTATION=- /assembly_acc=CAM_ASM_000160